MKCPKYYYRGPRDGLTGWDSYSIRDSVYLQVCSDYCKASSKCKPFVINMTGWSRGAVIVMGVADKLDLYGCSCNGNTYSVSVNWIGLFDAVNMIWGGGWPSTVPGNVKHFDHAIKTMSQIVFPTVLFGGNEVPFTRYDGSDTSHNDIGANRVNNEAFHWIREQAIAAEVPF